MGLRPVSQVLLGERMRMGPRNPAVVSAIGDLSTGFLKSLFKLHAAGTSTVEKAKQCWLQWVSTSEYVFHDWKAAFSHWMKAVGNDPANACESLHIHTRAILGYTEAGDFKEKS